MDTLTQEALAFRIDRGDWLEDLGDAPFYGLAFYARAPNAPGADRAAQAHDRVVSLLTNADFFNGDLQEMVMSAHGLVEYVAATGDRRDLPVLDQFVDRIDNLLSLIGWYPDVDAQKSWALQTYGPTSIAALIGLLDAEYALLVGGDRKNDRIDWAVQMAQHIDDRAYNGSFYEFGAGRTGLVDYPNIAMMVFEARLYELTHDESRRARALALYQALQPLRLPDGRYTSVYSASEFGAKTPDYSTLSSQNYMTIALMMLYEITGKASYVREADAIVEALVEKIHGTWCLSNVHAETTCMPACAPPAPVCVVSTCSADACQPGMLHHWIDGRPAVPSDPTFFCSGCNLQMLYALQYRSTRL